MNEAETNTVSLWSCNVGDRIYAPEEAAYPGDGAVVIKKEAIPRDFDDALMVRIQYENEGSTEDFDCSTDDIQVVPAPGIPVEHEETEEPFNPESFTTNELDKMLTALEGSWEKMAVGLNGESLFAYDRREKILIEYFSVQYQLTARLINYARNQLVDTLPLIDVKIEEVNSDDASMEEGDEDPTTKEVIAELEEQIEASLADCSPRPVDGIADDEHLDVNQDDSYEGLIDDEPVDVKEYCTRILLPQADKLAENITHVAMDANKHWYAYEEEPRTKKTMFNGTPHYFIPRDYPKIDLPSVDAEHWLETLVKIR